MATLLLTPLLIAGIFHTYVDFQDFKVKIFGEPATVYTGSTFREVADSTIRICPCYPSIQRKNLDYELRSVVNQRDGSSVDFKERKAPKWYDSSSYDFFWFFKVDTLGEHDSFLLHFEKPDTSRGVVLRDSVVLKLKRKSMTCLKPFCAIIRG